MAKLEINAIFYSKQNLNLAYEIKNVCRNAGISLIYAFEVPELVRYLNEIKMDIIFVDCSTIKINESIIGFIKSYANSKNSIMIGVNVQNCKILDPQGLDYIVNSNNLLAELKALENTILSHLAKHKSLDYNVNEINSYLSSYLISIGLAPKHVGFTFIKQVIELALKHGVIGSLSKDIYPTIASKNKTFAQNVERNIRNAIECACKTNEIKKDNIRFLINNNKISNRAFLCYLLDQVTNAYSHKKQQIN